MAVRQYVGARYVPKFADPVAWQSGTSYEALTIVTYNNSSYTSKIPVPATVGNPADNDQYWALTGNYNAQIEEYRESIDEVQNGLTTVNNNLNTEIQNRTNADQTLTTSIANNKNNILNKSLEVVCIGDSYGLGYKWDDSDITDRTHSWPALLGNMTGWTIYNYSKSGTGFLGYHADQTFYYQLQEAYAKHPNADIVIIAGGSNDIDPIVTDSDISTALSYAKNNFVNSRIYVFWNSCCYTHGFTNKILAYETYLGGCSGLGIPFANVAPYARIQSNGTSSDGIHLQQRGYREQAKAIAAFINGVTLPGQYSRLTLGTNVYMVMSTEVAHIYTNGLQIGSGTTFTEETALNNLNIGTPFSAPSDFPYLFGNKDIRIQWHANVLVNTTEAGAYIPCFGYVTPNASENNLDLYVTGMSPETPFHFASIEASHRPTLYYHILGEIPMFYLC